MATVNEKLTAIADAIRKETYSEEKLTLDDMAAQIPIVSSLGYDKGHMDGYFQRTGEDEERTTNRKAKLDEALRLTSVDIDESIEIANNFINTTYVFLDDSCNMYPEDVAENGLLSTLVTAWTNNTTASYTEGETAGIEQGKQSAYDEFWDSYQDNGKRTDYESAFRGQGWNDTTFKPKYSMTPQYAGNMFRECKATNVDLTDIVRIDSQCWGYVAMCRDFKGLVKFGNFYCAHNNCQEIFYECTNLTTVKKFTSESTTVFSLTFFNCTALADITFAGTIGNSLDIRYSPLNRASIESIIGCLSATTTGKTLTLKKTAVNTAFETSEGAADGSTSSEWITLITSKSNNYDGTWTISLV